MLRCALLNRKLLDFDDSLDFSPIRAVTALRIFDESTTSQVREQATDMQVLITKEQEISAEIMKDLPSVRLICEAGTGYDRIDVKAAKELGVVVCNVPAYSTAAVAQLVLSFLLGIACGTLDIARRLGQNDRSDHLVRPVRAPFELRARILGVVGAGSIGGEVARSARALGMEVRVYSRHERDWGDPGIRQCSLEELLATSDFVSLHLPLSEFTRGIISRERLANMRPGAWIINTARGGLIDEQALVEALAAGALGGAALDVQDPEPPCPESPLWSMKNVLLTPHIGWKATEARQRLIGQLAENICAFAAGKPINQVS